MGIHSYGLFVLAGILLNLTPGQDSMFIIGRSLTGGLRAGVAAAVGISAGSIFHTLAAALGLSAILATSPAAFTIVKLDGAAYLVLPQFIEVGSANQTLAFLALGATFIVTGLIWCLVLAVGAAQLRVFFLRNPTVRTFLDRAVGGLFVALGARLAWMRQ